MSLLKMPPALMSTRRDLVAAAGGAMAGGLLFLAAHNALIDDAYITLGYARQLTRGHWGMIPGAVANTATSPLNVWLIAAGALLTGSVVVGTGMILTASIALVAVCTARIARRLDLPWWVPVLTVGLLVTSPLLVSTIGLETYLAVALIVALGYAAIEGKPAVAGLVCGLLVLTRPDLVVFPVVAVLGVTALRRRALLIAGIALVMGLPWWVGSWWWLGSAIPDTLVIKANGGWANPSDPAHPTRIDTGWWMYLKVYPAAVALATVPFLAGLLTLAAWVIHPGRRDTHQGTGTLLWIFGVGGLGHLAALTVLGADPYHWYYGPSLAALTVCAAFGAAAYRPHLAVIPAVVLTGLVVVCATLGVALAPWQVTPITTNWALPGQYARVGQDLARSAHGEVVGSGVEAGTIAYFCDCHLSDLMSDRGKMLPRIRAAEQRPGLAGLLMRLNYRRLRPADPPPASTMLIYRPETGGDGWDVWSPWRKDGHISRLAGSPT